MVVAILRESSPTNKQIFIRRESSTMNKNNFNFIRRESRILKIIEFVGNRQK